MRVIPVILAGGVGTRLWPLSRKSKPKQFLKLTNDKFSMFQETVLRAQGLSNNFPIIVCADEHRFIVAEQLREVGIDSAQIILEPIGKNTAPAITLAALAATDQCKNSILIVLAADHFVSDQHAFISQVGKGLDLAEQGYMVTFGVLPDYAEVGYGYIKSGAPISGSAGFLVDSFVEKPTLALAEEYVLSKKYLWNSGMFAFQRDLYLRELQKFEPVILATCQDAFNASQIDMDFIRIPGDIFEQSPSQSIDYAVMEHTQNAAVVPLSVGWSDLGAWEALWKIAEQDENNNVLIGDVCVEDSQGVYVKADSRLVAVVGLRDLVVVETKDAVLISERTQSQKVKTVVERLREQGRDEFSAHKQVYRPWGTYESIDEGERYQVKRITVQPGGKLSVQMHHHRAEHWIVVSGVARVTNGDETYLVTENESTYIPIGQIHALENPGVIPLELIEVQSGAYLGEDDIVRFEDRYGRI